MVAGSIEVRLNDVDRLVTVVKQLTIEGVMFHVKEETDCWHIEIERV